MSQIEFADEQEDELDDYIYVDDDITAADELAETQCPSPGYSGTNAELAAEFYEWDSYEFYADVEYGNDGYWDSEPRASKATDAALKPTNGKKRKREMTAAQTPDKRRKTAPAGAATSAIDKFKDSVVFRQPSPTKLAPVVSPHSATFALFPDWQKKFPQNADIAWTGVMPEDMKRAAEANEEEDAHTDGQTELLDEDASHAVPTVSNKKRRKAQAKRMVQPEYPDDEDGAPSLDMDAIRSVLRQRLGDTSLDEEQFMAVINQMFGENGSADEALEKLTAALLDSGNADSAGVDWLGSQGVNFDSNQEDADSEESSARRVDSGAGLPVDLKESDSPDVDAQIARNKKRKYGSGADPAASGSSKEQKTPRKSARIHK